MNNDQETCGSDSSDDDTRKPERTDDDAATPAGSAEDLPDDEEDERDMPSELMAVMAFVNLMSAGRIKSIDQKLSVLMVMVSVLVLCQILS